jgi:hypothetical protein
MKRVEQSHLIDPAKAMASFLSKMAEAAQRTYPLWRERLMDGLVDVAPEGSALYDQLVTHQPLEDYYFAGVVAYEAATVRRHLEPDLASELLSELAAQIDRSAGRSDRIVSDLTFFILGRLELESGLEAMTMPYDKTVQIILQRIGLERDEATRPLMNDVAFRHGLGEPLARGIPAWWKKFALEHKRRATAAKQSGHLALVVES